MKDYCLVLIVSVVLLLLYLVNKDPCEKNEVQFQAPVVIKREKFNDDYSDVQVDKIYRSPRLNPHFLSYRD